MNPTEFGSALEAGLADLRAFAQARMTSRATVRRKTGAPTIVNGFKTAGWSVIHANLPVRIHGSERSRRVETGGVEMEVPVRVASFPHDTADLRDGDLLEITSGDTAGQVYRLVEVEPADQTTARRVPVVGAERPTEWL